MKNVEFWVTWADGTICSKHHTLAAAKKAMKACERRANAARHAIYRTECIVSKGETR